MIDFINLLNVVLKDASCNDALLNNPLLNDYWQTNVKTQNGEVKKEFAKYLGLNIIVRNGNIRLSGSIHKYRNKGEHNHDDFKSIDAIQVLNELSRDFEIDLHKTQINNLEFGVNVVLPFKVSLILENLVCYKGSIFTQELEEGKRFHQCKKEQFIIKIYDKGKQYRLPDNVLRFEVKVMKKQYFEWLKIPVYWLSDLLNQEIYPQLAEVLLTTFNDILFTDTRIDTSKMSASEQILYHKGCNPHTWTIKTQNGKEKKERQRLKVKFVELLNKYENGIDFKETTSEKIAEKSKELSLFYRTTENETIEKVSLSYRSTESKTNNKIVPFLPIESNEIPVKKCLYLTAQTEGENIKKVSLSYRTNKPFWSVLKNQLQNAIVPFLHFKYNVRKGHGANVSDFELPIKKTLCSGCGKPLKEHQKTYHNDDCKQRKIARNKMSNKRLSTKRKYGKTDDVLTMFKSEKLT